MKYITRSIVGIIVDGNKNKEFDIGLKQHLNLLCIKELSSLKGRQEASGRILGSNRLLPFYVDDSTFLFPTSSLRNMDAFLINYHRVLSITKINSKNTRILFDDYTHIMVNSSVNRIKNQMLRIQNIMNYCKKQ